MTKRQLVELIQERLASGDVPNDIMGRYKYQTVVALLDIVYQETASVDINALGTMVEPYALPVLVTGTQYYSDLNVSPAYGPMSVKYAIDYGEEGDTIFYSRQSDDQNLFLNRIKNMSKPEFYVRDKRVLWTSDPGSVNVTYFIIPAFLSMSDTQEIVVPTTIGALATRVIELIRSTDTRAEEVIADLAEDNNPKPTKFSE